MGWGDLTKAGEDVELQRWDLGDGFDDEVDRREVVHVSGRGEAAADEVGIRLGDALFGDIFGKKLVCRSGKVREVLCFRRGSHMPANLRPLSIEA